MAVYDIDLFVIGAGSGGVRAARIAAAHGAKVMIAEEFRIGGTCVIRGCVPKKLMVYASRYKDHFEDGAGFGWNLAAPSFDWPRLVAAKEKEISRLSAIYRDNLEKAGIAVEDGRAEIEDANHVRLLGGGRKVSARIILIATGAAPVLEPDVPGRENAITSNEVFDLPELPRRMLIVGGGYIAVEFASIFARLGTEVSLAVRGENVLRGFDDDMRIGLRERLADAGVKLNFGKLPIRIEKTSTGYHVSFTKGMRLEADRVMIATGRRPNTSGLGLENAGVERDSLGAVRVDSFSKTNVEFDLCCRRCHQQGRPDARGHSRGARFRRDGFWRQAGGRRAQQHPDCRLLDAGTRVCRPDRDGRAGEVRLRRHLPRELPLLEGGPLRAAGENLDEDRRRWRDRPRPRRAYSRRGRQRDGTTFGNCR